MIFDESKAHDAGRKQIVPSSSANLEMKGHGNLRYYIDPQKIIHSITQTNKFAGKPDSFFDGASTHNIEGAELICSPDFSADHMTTMHVYGYRHENPNHMGKRKGKVVEEVYLEAFGDGLVSTVSIENPSGRVDIYPHDDLIVIQKFDPENPPGTMFQHAINEKLAGHPLPYTVIPNGQTKISSLQPNQIEKVKELVEYGLGYIVPTIEIQDNSPKILPILGDA